MSSVKERESPRREFFASIAISSLLLLVRCMPPSSSSEETEKQNNLVKDHNRRAKELLKNYLNPVFLEDYNLITAFEKSGKTNAVLRDNLKRPKNYMISSQINTPPNSNLAINLRSLYNSDGDAISTAMDIELFPSDKSNSLPEIQSFMTRKSGRSEIQEERLKDVLSIIFQLPEGLTWQTPQQTSKEKTALKVKGEANLEDGRKMKLGITTLGEIEFTIFEPTSQSHP